MGYKFPNVILSGLKQTTNAEMWLKTNLIRFQLKIVKRLTECFVFTAKFNVRQLTQKGISFFACRDLAFLKG